MKALHEAIETAKALAVENHRAEQFEGWEKPFGGLAAGWEAHKVAQQVEVSAPCGAKVTVIAGFAAAAGTAGGPSSIRITYKLNGKRAKAADVEKLFSAKPLFTAADKRQLSALFGL